MSTVVSIDAGIGPRFMTSRGQLQIVVETAIAAHRNDLDIDFAYALSKVQMWNKILEAESILHLSGHGHSSGRIGGKRLRQMDVQDFAKLVYDEDFDFPLDCLIVDACSTFSPDWIRYVTASLPRGKQCVFIGTKADVPFENAEIYVQVFFQTLISRRYPKGSRARRDWLVECHRTASAAEKWYLGESYFKCKVLTGNRS